MTAAAAAAASEETLDPQDWEGFRELAHGMLDRMIDLQRDVRHLPAWRPIPPDVDARFLEPAPRAGIGTERAFREFAEMVLPYPTGNLHPRFWGWAGGQGSPTGMMGDLFAAAMNSVTGIFNDSAARVEAQVIDWMKESLGFPADASGFVTSGGSVANLVALAAARDDRVGFDVGSDGLAAASSRPVFYVSAETHSSMFKAAKLLGVGTDGVRVVPVDESFRMDVAALRHMVREDLDRGLTPFAVVGTAGTINTGAVDDLPALHRVAQEAGLWFHVDGAFGAMAALSPDTAQLVRGIQDADSVAFDFHKWMFTNYEGGGVLIRDRNAHLRAFSTRASYLEPLPRGTGAQPDSSNLRGPQLSKGFKALKVWLTIKEQGLDTFGRLVRQNIRQARELGELIDASDRVVRLTPVSLNVVAFRYHRDGMSGETSDAVNRELLMRIQERGIAVPSQTVIGGRFALRACIINHRSRAEDFRILVNAVEGIGDEVFEELVPRAAAEVCMGT
jgi:glutamate/tyrosine decarboxylase-like PLP-dependent enzyme